MTFPKKFLLGGNELYRIQNGTASQLWIRCKEFCTMKEAKRVMEIILIVFFEKNLVRGNWSFWSKNGTSSYFSICSQVFYIFNFAQ